ncbi:uncharacterized protein DUF937 [Novosphingobium sp. PhB165]|uniref:OmpA family protein n=1 Tax=Novosphingobium sp. PhB165 TaxID=2485105 RepID=UPI001042C804|nr:OmpA family protein [Novosphingobium sp. PhB165]TCM21409.1 uncharacterized protein DUF937 [Novosphingobium sp. PhB165]
MALLDTIRGAIAPGTVDNLAAKLGESPQATGIALGGIVPVILAAMSSRVAAGSGGGVLSMIKAALASGNPLDHQAALTDRVGAEPAITPHGGGFPDLFGSNFGGLVSTLAGHYGIAPQSVRSLLGVGGLFAAGGIGKLLGSTPSLPEVTTLLNGERASIHAALPPGVSGLLGSPAATASQRLEEPVRAASGGMGKWWPLLLLLLAIIALIWALRSCSNKEVTTPSMEPTAAVEPSPMVEPTPTAAIPTGSGMVSEVTDGRPVLRVFFAVGKSDVTKDLSNAASSVKEYLDAHPGSFVAVSGYNDPTGDPVANAALSKRRAEEVSKALVDTGIPAASIKMIKPADTTGNGDTNAQARRVDVTVGE